MTIEEFLQDYSVLPEVARLAERVRERSGTDIDFIADPNAPYPAMVEMARGALTRHLFVFHPSRTARLNYYLAYKCAALLRIAEVPAEERLFPMAGEESMARAIASVKSAAQEPLAVQDETLRLWISGVVAQLGNLPGDIQVERLLHREFPALRPEQKAHIQEDTAETRDGLSREVERLAPASIFTASTAMAYAYLRAVGELTGTNYTKPFYDYPRVLRSGKDLFAMVGPDGGWAGDRETIGEWAEYLGIGDWFEWRSIEELPLEYVPESEAKEEVEG